MAGYSRRVTAEDINALVVRASLRDLLSEEGSVVFEDTEGSYDAPVTVEPGMYRWSGYAYPPGTVSYSTENRRYLSVYFAVFADPDSPSGIRCQDAVELGGHVVRITNVRSGGVGTAYDKCNATVAMGGELWEQCRTVKLTRFGI